MKECPSREQLDLLMSEKLGAEDQAAVETHISSCVSCRKTLTSLTPGATQEWAPTSRAKSTSDDESSLPDGLKAHPRYEVVGVLGRGGMGIVYKAEHRLLERPVVLKVIRSDLLDNPAITQRFQREAKLAAKLTHPNIVAVYEAEELGATQLLVMEYIDGVDLGELVSQRGLLPVAESCEMVRQAAVGLQQVHDQGLVHRH